MDMDSRGVKRGMCTSCSNCAGYRRNIAGSNVCQVCQCAPGKHQAAKNGTVPSAEQAVSRSPGDWLAGPAKLTSKLAELRLSGDSEELTELVATKCKYCNDDVHFDINTGIEHQYCGYHLANPPIATGGAAVTDYNDQHGNSSAGAIAFVPSLPPPPVTQTQISLSRSIQAVCAIEECGEPRHVDPNGMVHECCGYTHAMELIRRKIIEGTKQTMVKGVTHCLLPKCNSITWPFMNYCKRTHADEGKKLGLKPPAQPILRSASATASLCQLPGCTRPKCPKPDGRSFYDFCGLPHASKANTKEAIPSERTPKTTSLCMLEGCHKEKCKKTDGTGTLYDYCSLPHAEAAASSAKTSVTKDDSICIIQECTRRKFVDPDTKEMSDFCTIGHVAKGRTLGLPVQRKSIEAILTSMKDVKKFLEQFSGTLSVVELKENDHAKPSGALYKKFIIARNQLPMTDRKTCLAFHGSPDQNIDSICANGYDSAKRSGQAHGPGEYFATTPSTPISYCHGGKRLLLNELLLGQNKTHHTQHGDIIVMKYPEHDLPRFVITFR